MPSIALILGLERVAAVVADSRSVLTLEEIRSLLGVAPASVGGIPPLLLRRCEDDGAEWYTLRPVRQRVSAQEAKQFIEANGEAWAPLNSALARVLVASIHSYYFRQSQEPR